MKRTRMKIRKRKSTDEVSFLIFAVAIVEARISVTTFCCLCFFNNEKNDSFSSMLQIGRAHV